MVVAQGRSPNFVQRLILSTLVVYKCLQVGQCQMQKCMTPYIGKNPQYHVAVAIRRMGTDKICPAEKSCPDDVEKDNYFQIYSKILYHDWFSACPFFA